MIFQSDALVDMDAEKQADGNCFCPLKSKYIRVLLSTDNLFVQAGCVEVVVLSHWTVMYIFLVRLVIVVANGCDAREWHTCEAWG